MVKRFAVFFDRDFFPFEFALFAMEIVYTMPVDRASLGGQYGEKEPLVFRLESVLRTNNIRDCGERNTMTDLSALVRARITFIPKFPERVLLAFSEIHVEHPDPLQVPFVPFEGLYRIIAASFRERGISALEHRDLGIGRLLDLFSRVEVDEGGRPILTWAHQDMHVVKGRPPADHGVLGGLYVTERWASGVLGLVNRGIVRVSAERVPSIDDSAGAVCWLPFGYNKKNERFSIMPHTDSVFVAVPAPL